MKTLTLILIALAMSLLILPACTNNGTTAQDGKDKACAAAKILLETTKTALIAAAAGLLGVTETFEAAAAQGLDTAEMIEIVNKWKVRVERAKHYVTQAEIAYSVACGLRTSRRLGERTLSDDEIQAGVAGLLAEMR